MDPDQFTGVKALVEKGLDRLPPRFIRPFEERRGELMSDENIPLIDLQLGHHHHHHHAALCPTVVEAIGRACHEWGCFQVVNHGITPSVMNEMMQAARDFFALPEQDKMKHFTLDSTSSKFRYGSSFNLQKDKVLSWRDFIRYSTHPLHDVISLWPQNPPAFRKASVNYCTEIHEVVKVVCGAISESLGVGNIKCMESGEYSYSQMMVCNYYPKCPEAEWTLGVGRHTDPGWITALMQDNIDGLQVFHAGRWVAAHLLPNALFVNLGDVLQIVSNGIYKSVEHRATVNGSRDRLSVLTTYGPSLDAIIKPAPELLLAKGCKPAYGEIVYKDYMHRILNGSLEDKPLVDFHDLQIQYK